MIFALIYSFNEGPILAPSLLFPATAPSDYCYCGIISPEAAPKSRLGLDRQVVASVVEVDAGPGEDAMMASHYGGYADVSDIDILNYYLSP